MSAIIRQTPSGQESRTESNKVSDNYIKTANDVPTPASGSNDKKEPLIQPWKETYVPQQEDMPSSGNVLHDRPWYDNPNNKPETKKEEDKDMDTDCGSVYGV